MGLTTRASSSQTARRASRGVAPSAAAVSERVRGPASRRLPFNSAVLLRSQPKGPHSDQCTRRRPWLVARALEMESPRGRLAQLRSGSLRALSRANKARRHKPLDGASLGGVVVLRSLGQTKEVPHSTTSAPGPHLSAEKLVHGPESSVVVWARAPPLDGPGARWSDRPRGPGTAVNKVVCQDNSIAASSCMEARERVDGRQVGAANDRPLGKPNSLIHLSSVVEKFVVI